MSTCSGFGQETFMWPNPVKIGTKKKVRCRDCHGSVEATVIKQKDRAVTVDIPKHERAVPWHKRGY